MNFLNNGAGYDLFVKEARKKSYIDKTMLLHAVYQYAQETNSYICITRPRRFGKSTAANMIAAFFDESTAEESEKLFSKLAIGNLKEDQKNAKREDDTLPLCWPMQGKGKVIRINLINLLVPEVQSYQDLYNLLNRRILEDLKTAYPNHPISNRISIPEALENTIENMPPAYSLLASDHISNNYFYVSERGFTLESVKNYVTNSNPSASSTCPPPAPHAATLHIG